MEEKGSVCSIFIVLKFCLQYVQWAFIFFLPETFDVVFDVFFYWEQMFKSFGFKVLDYGWENLFNKFCGDCMVMTFGLEKVRWLSLGQIIYLLVNKQ